MARERIERRHRVSSHQALREPPARRPPAVAALLDFGNAAVARAVLARRPKDYSLGADGHLLLQAATVGWAGGGRSWVCVNPDTGEVGVPAPDADVGRADPGGSLLAVREATVDKTDTAHVKVTPKGPVLGIRFDPAAFGFGDPLLTKAGGAWTPLPLAQLPDALKAAITAAPEAHVRLKDGGFWALENGAWSASKHADVGPMRAAVTAEEAKLPTAALRQDVDRYVALMAAVMAHEGGFEATSDRGDDKGSIGIFQWALDKHDTNQVGASMVGFFAGLKARANAPAAGVDPAEHQLYVDAFKQVTDAGIDVDAAGAVTFHGHKATGAEIEAAVGGAGKAMSKGALRTYQLVAASEWIEALKREPVRPGPGATAWVGHGYEEKAGGQPGHQAMLVFKTGAQTFEFALEAPADVATVGGSLTSEEHLALAATLAVNRPHFVAAALWRALTGKSDVTAEVTAHLEEIARLHDAKLPRRRRGWHNVTGADISDWGADAEYAALLREIWPAPKVLTPAQEQALAGEFKHQGLSMYGRGDARPDRFATVEDVYAP